MLGNGPAKSVVCQFISILQASLYGLRVVVAGTALWYFRETYRKLDWRFGWFGAAIGLVVFAIWIGLASFANKSIAGPPAAFLHATPVARFLWIAVRVLGAAATVPIAEELAFRGYLLRRIASADFESVSTQNMAWPPSIVSSLAFGLLHGGQWLAGAIAGMLYAFAMIRRGRIGEAVLAHALTNALLAARVLATGNWQLW